MKKSKKYYELYFTADALRESVTQFLAIAEAADREISSRILEVEQDESVWAYDTLDEFFSSYRAFSNGATIQISRWPFSIYAQMFPRWTSFSVEAPTRESIESVFEVLERHAPSCKLPPNEKPKKKDNPVVFIGHGRSPLWRELKDHLQDKHGVVVSAFETGARAGHAIRDILEQLADDSSFALLVHTADDEVKENTWRARQNVVHETGLFQGRLGFSRAIMLVEEGVELFSNVDGIQQIRFSPGNIKETFGEGLATIRREFPPES